MYCFNVGGYADIKVDAVKIDYLKHVLGLDATYYEGSVAHLLYFISFTYDVKKVALDGNRAVFVDPK